MALKSPIGLDLAREGRFHANFKYSLTMAVAGRFFSWNSDFPVPAGLVKLKMAGICNVKLNVNHCHKGPEINRFLPVFSAWPVRFLNLR